MYSQPDPGIHSEKTEATGLCDTALASSQPPTVSTVNRRRGRSISIELPLPASKLQKMQTDSSKSCANVSTEKTTRTSEKPTPVPPAKCTNKHIMEAINKLSTELTTRIDTVEHTLKQRIMDLEKTLEDKLMSSLNSAVDTKVQQAMTEIRTEVDEQLQSPLKDIHGLKAETKVIRDDIHHLQDENHYVTDMLLQHQKYLESQEAAKRSANVIITGLPEVDLLIGEVSYQQDEDKVRRVFDEMDRKTVDFKECIRLGKPVTSRIRPLKVVLKDNQERKDLLANSKFLKNKGTPLSKVYVKKDVHPMVRKEFARLRSVEKEEKDKPENTGRTVKYDAETRSVLIDGVVVDKFRPSFL
jgi:small-conductance mechanosensitive channel